MDRLSLGQGYLIAVWRTSASVKKLLKKSPQTERLCHDLKSSPNFELPVRSPRPFLTKYLRERSPSRKFNPDTAEGSGSGPATTGSDPATITAQRPSQLIMNCCDWAGPALR